MVCALIASGLAAYANSLSGPFISDDLTSIPENPHIRSLWPLWNALSAPPQSTVAGRPAVALSLAMNYALGGLNVRGYHLFNIAVHVLCSIILMGIVRRTLLSPALDDHFSRTGAWLAFATAMLWMLHPLQTEAVNYLVQRTELLMGLFYLLTLYCALRSFASQRPHKWQFLAVAFCALGMASKEVMASAPLMVLLYDRAFASGSLLASLKGRPAFYASLGLTWIILAALILSGPRSESVGFTLGISAAEYLMTQAGVIIHYLRLALWPHPLVVCYSDWPVASSLSAVLPQGLAVIGLLASAIWLLRRNHVLGFLGAWFFLILAPTTSFVPIVTELVAERRMYLPLAALLALLVTCTWQLLALGSRLLRLGRSSAPLGCFATAVVVATIFGWLTAVRNDDYRTELGIWNDTLVKRPLNSHAYYNRAMVYCAEEEYDLALADFNKAIQLGLGDAETHLGRGNAYCMRGDYRLAIADFERAITLRPQGADAWYNRGVARMRSGEGEAAFKDFTRAVELKPDYAQAYNNRGNILKGRGDLRGAIRDFTRAVSFNPQSPEPYNNRGTAHAMGGAYREAVSDFTTAIQLRPQAAEPYCNRAVSHYSLGDYEQARSDLQACQERGGTPPGPLVEALSNVTPQAP